MSRLFLIFFLLFSFLVHGNWSIAQENLRVSLLTCGPGIAEAYQSFGHTAIRIRNDSTGMDKVYNYGVFDFHTDGFYLKFIQGKLLYYLDIEPYYEFLDDYIQQNRWVREQILDIPTDKKWALFQALEENALPENKFYLYDFTHNNCSTKPRDIIAKILGPSFEYRETPKANTTTFRQMIDSYMYYNEWMDLGIDLLLGRRLDKVADQQERMFLPEELMEGMDNALFKGRPVVRENKIIYQNQPVRAPFIPGPGLFLWAVLAILIIQQTRSSYVTEARGIGFTYFFLTGLVGCILVFMWWGTDHVMTKWNFNLLWAFPLHFPMSFWLLKKDLPLWVKRYFFFFRVFLVVIIVLWAFKPQEFHRAVMPLCLIGVWCISKFHPVPKVKIPGN